jgi:predicted enzyme related to lactoylglutathione lyase
MSLPRRGRSIEQGMAAAPNPVVHLELRTGNLPCACAFLTRLFRWRAETVHLGSGRYLSLELGGRIDGGVVESESGRPLWLPYVQVADVGRSTDLAREHGASVYLEPREGPAGWRSIIETPAGGEIALWQPKT